MHTFDALDAASLRSDIPEFRAGDTLKVHVKVVEGTRSRVQIFQGVVIRRHGGGIGETFTVRKISFGVGVERTFPLHTPIIDRIEVVTRGDVRRAKLYYLRGLRGKAAKIREKRETVPAKRPRPRPTELHTDPRPVVTRGPVVPVERLPVTEETPDAAESGAPSAPSAPRGSARADDPQTAEPPAHADRGLRWLIGPAVALLLVLAIRTLLVAPFSIPSGSMEDTLDVGDRLLVTRTTDAEELERGDLVVFDASRAFTSRSPTGVCCSPRSTPSRGLVGQEPRRTTSSGSSACPATGSVAVLLTGGSRSTVSRWTSRTSSPARRRAR